VTVYFAGDTGVGERLFQERREFGGRPDALAWALSNVIDGNALDPDYTSPWPQGTTVRSARRVDSLLEVDLSGPVAARPGSMSLPTANVAVQQLVRTAQDVSGTRLPVRFLHDGHDAATLLGTSTGQPVARSVDNTTLAPVFVSSPTDQEIVASPFTVTGQASAFEGNVQWELKQGGTVVRRGFTTTEECCTLSPYSFKVSAPPGTYTLVVHDEDVSDGEGSPPSSDTKQVRVR
jgi:Immunoglobulin-like domain of bacterial spore germination/Sporulation and spore germination